MAMRYYLTYTYNLINQRLTTRVYSDQHLGKIVRKLVKAGPLNFFVINRVVQALIDKRRCEEAYLLLMSIPEVFIDKATKKIVIAIPLLPNPC